MNRKEKSPAGMILRAERIRQGKGQKEVCYGICVVSYLSKIERGSAEPDMAILKQLFARLGIDYETDSAFLTESRQQMDKFFYNLQYGLENETVWKKLAGKWDRLLMSPFVIDIRLVAAVYYSESIWKEVDESFIERFMEKETDGNSIGSFMKNEVDGNDIQNFLDKDISTLAQLEDCMDEKQYAYYSLVCSRLTKDPAEKMKWYQKVQHGLQNTLGMCCLIAGYYEQAEYDVIHRMENRFVTAALEEGNVYALADYYFMNGSAYACVNMDEMMTVYYERTRRMLQNTGWWKEYEQGLYYNMGATYLAVGRYEEALACLNRVRSEDFLHCHKKGWLHLRLGNTREADRYLAKMKLLLSQKEMKDKTAEHLMYEELCMEQKPDFTADPAYLDLIERLITALKKEKSFGFLYQYKDVILEAYMRQRKYKKALEFSEQISAKTRKSTF